jgi:hypothetical protein
VQCLAQTMARLWGIQEREVIEASQVTDKSFPSITFNQSFFYSLNSMVMADGTPFLCDYIGS